MGLATAVERVHRSLAMARSEVMAIPCEACSRPVHEQAVVCPHCGDHTGVPADPDAAVLVAALPAVPEAVTAPPSTPEEAVASVIAPIVEAIGVAVGSALELLGGEPESPLPRAVARERQGRAITAESDKESAREAEPVRDVERAEQPRILT